jgi:hypothetical protein
LFMVAPFSGLLVLLCGRVGFAYAPFIREPRPLATPAFWASLAERNPWGPVVGPAPDVVQAPLEGA